MLGTRSPPPRPLQIGAALAGAPPEQIAALEEFGDPLRDAFRLCDDVLGVFGNRTVTGKSVLDDLREGKRTVMMALAHHAADRSQSARLRELFGNLDLDAGGAAELRQIIPTPGARDRIEQMIQVRVEAALAVLGQLAVTAESRAALTVLAATRSEGRLVSPVSV